MAVWNGSPSEILFFAWGNLNSLQDQRHFIGLGWKPFCDRDIRRKNGYTGLGRGRGRFQGKDA
jgi:hypothetical protein